MSTHVLERTNPKGEPFIGTCTLCGTKGLTAAQANEPCPNPNKISSDDALLGAITGDGDTLRRMGDDAAKWAAEFVKTATRLGHPGLDEDWVRGWFANAIEHSTDIRTSKRSEAINYLRRNWQDLTPAAMVRAIDAIERA
jgi:hypothetical protein